MRRLIAVALIVAVSSCSTVQTVTPAPAEVCAQPGLWAVLARSGAEAGGPPVPLSGGSAVAAGAKAGALGSLKSGAGLAGEMLSDTVAEILPDSKYCSPARSSRQAW